jgi:hypothetical protein
MMEFQSLDWVVGLDFMTGKVKVFVFVFVLPCIVRVEVAVTLEILILLRTSSLLCSIALVGPRVGSTSYFLLESTLAVFYYEAFFAVISVCSSVL